MPTFAGLDVSQAKTTVCIVDEPGLVTWRGCCATSPGAIVQTLATRTSALERVGLADLRDRFPEDLSGGEQQRVAIARAVVGDRQLLLADEPTGALDSITGEAVLRLLRQACDDDGAAAVLVTHDAAHAAWADRVVFLRDGRVVDGTGGVSTGPGPQLAGEARR
jgi:putative ABC transport system ATP-binding protein